MSRRVGLPCDNTLKLCRNRSVGLRAARPWRGSPALRGTACAPVACTTRRVSSARPSETHTCRCDTPPTPCPCDWRSGASELPAPTFADTNEALDELRSDPSGARAACTSPSECPNFYLATRGTRSHPWKRRGQSTRAPLNRRPRDASWSMLSRYCPAAAR